jgi:WD40 repeat protein
LNILDFVCKAWSHFHKEDYLWKHMYYRDIIDLHESGPLPNLPFATLFKKCALYRSWKLVHTHKTHDEAWQVSVSPNGQYIASSDKAGALKIWKLKIQQDPTP